MNDPQGSSPLLETIVEQIRANGPMTVAHYMDLVLYHPELGYYSRAARRTGRTGDFFTSVDVGSVFGELLCVQLAEMWRIVRRAERPVPGSGPGSFDLVEAGAGTGQLARDILDAAAAVEPEFYAAARLHLVERSPRARVMQPEVLAPHADTLAASSPDLPGAVTGVIFANELLDALPTHQVVMTHEGLREIFVDECQGRLVERIGLPSTPAIEDHLQRVSARLEPGWRAEVNLAEIAWVQQAARALGRGFLMLIDYGHEAAELYSAAHASGTLATYHRHRLGTENRASRSAPTAGLPAQGGLPPWLQDPGDRDLTAHVDFTSVRMAGEHEGLQTLAFLDQTYFLLGLGAAERLAANSGGSLKDLKRRLALKTLILPGGLGSSHKALIFGKNVGTPSLRASSYGMRVT